MSAPLDELGRILIVDDDPQLLSGLARNLRRLIPVETANGGEDALALLRRDNNFSIIMCDMRMPGMNGAEFFSKARLQLPDAVRILLTGQADLAAVISAINDGHIDRFLAKPVERDDLMRVIGAAMAHYRLKKDEARQLEHARRLAVDWGQEALSLGSVDHWGRAVRVRRMVRLLGEHLGLRDVLSIEMTAVIAVTAEVVACQCSRQQTLEAMKSLAGRSEGMDEVRAMLDELQAAHHAQPNDSSPPMRVSTRLVHLALRLDRENGPLLHRLDRLERAGALDVRLGAALRDLSSALEPAGRACDVRALEPGLRLLEPLHTNDGRVIAPEGVVVTAVLLARLASATVVELEVKVVSDAETAPTPVPFSATA